MTERESWLNVGQRVRSLRKENCLTLKQLASGCSLSTNAISLIERGQVAPTIETLCKIAHALGVSAASLFQDICSTEVVLCRSNDPLYPVRTKDGVAILTQLAHDPLLSSKDTAEACEGLAISHTVVCVCGHLVYQSDSHFYELLPGDQLTFSGDATGHWNNPGDETVVALLFVPAATNLSR